MADRAAGNDGHSIRDVERAWTGSLFIVIAALLTARSPIFALPFVLVLISAFFVLVARDPQDPGTARRLLTDIAPVAAFALASFVVYEASAARIGVSHGVYLGLGVFFVGWVAAAAVGYGASTLDEVPVLAAAAATVWASVLVSALDVAQRAGLSTGIGRAYVAWSTAVSWVPSAGEPFRAVGLEIDPNAFGLIGLVALVPALTVTARPKLRGVVAAGAIVVLGLAASRTAFAAAIIASIVSLLPFVRGENRARRAAEQLRPVGVGLAAALLVGVLAIGLVGGQISMVERLTSSISVIAGVSQSGSGATTAADTATGGRVQIWAEAWQVYLQHPFGLFRPPEVLVGKSIHNEYLERLLIGGPLLLAALLAFLAWLFVKVRPASAPGFGPTMAVGYAAAAVALGPSLLAAFIVMTLFFVGWALAQQRRPARTGEARSIAENAATAM